MCFTGVASDLKTYMNKLQAGSLDFDRMKKYPKLSQLLTDAAQGGGYGCILPFLTGLNGRLRVSGRLEGSCLAR